MIQTDGQTTKERERKTLDIKNKQTKKETIAIDTLANFGILPPTKKDTKRQKDRQKQKQQELAVTLDIDI